MSTAIRRTYNTCNSRNASDRRTTSLARSSQEPKIASGWEYWKYSQRSDRYCYIGKDEDSGEPQFLDYGAKTSSASFVSAQFHGEQGKNDDDDAPEPALVTGWEYAEESDRYQYIGRDNDTGEPEFLDYGQNHNHESYADERINGRDSCSECEIDDDDEIQYPIAESESEGYPESASNFDELEEDYGREEDSEMDESVQDESNSSENEQDATEDDSSQDETQELYDNDSQDDDQNGDYDYDDDDDDDEQADNSQSSGGNDWSDDQASCDDDDDDGGYSSGGGYSNDGSY
eukprot:Nitzschia sp. Nitz4//scaffold209_size42451//41245//42111//NITZ4_007365-RA/size42451-processed-gene-0.33-mRNA-1//1//CDS//3329541721//5846//frame0